MWKIYGIRKGVAMVTTVRKLKEALAKSNQQVWIGNVDYEMSPVYNNRVLDVSWPQVLLKKRKPFQFEDEARAITPATRNEDANGICIPVCVKSLEAVSKPLKYDK